MRNFHGHCDVLAFAIGNLLASPRALVSKGDRIQRIRTIVPARSEANAGELRFPLPRSGGEGEELHP